MTCITCAAEIESGAVVCAHCGAAVVPPPPVAPPLAAENEPTLIAPLDADKHLEGLSGWLILVGFTLVISPFLIIHGLVKTDLTVLMEEEYRPFLEKHPAHHGLILFEAATNICYLALVLALLYLFFKKKRAFPTYMVLYMAFRLVAHLGLVAASHILQHSSKFTPQSIGNIVGTILGAAIWIPYFLVSRRVKVTFVR